MPDIITDFFLFYTISCLILMILFWIFRRVFRIYKLLYIPLIISCLIFFPAGLIIFGYYLRTIDERREKETYFDEIDENNDDIELEIEQRW